MNLLAFAIEFAGAYEFAAAARLGAAASNPPSRSIPGQADERVNLGAVDWRQAVARLSRRNLIRAALRTLRSRWFVSAGSQAEASIVSLPDTTHGMLFLMAQALGCAKCHKISLWYGLMIRTIGSL